MTRWLVLLAACSLAGSAFGAANLVRNGSFDGGADAKGWPAEWQASGDSRLVAQTLSLDKGRDGKPCARLACSRFQAGNPAAHAMLCQLGVPVSRGKTDRVTFWAKAESIEAETVSVALSDTSTWSDLGLQGSFAPGPEWERYEFFFTARRDCPKTSRFQLWFTSTGTLWVSDVEFVETGPEARRPGRIIPAAGHKNLIPNASFEVGTDGWGSAEWDRTAHWGGHMNALFGQIDDKEAFHGKHSLRIDLSPENQPVSFFDYYELSRVPIWAPLAANIGFIEVEPGKPYTFSAYLKAAEADTPARLAIRQFEGRSFEKAVRVSAKWERYPLTFTPTAKWCYVLAGPDLRKTEDTPSPPRQATVWLDALQLERGAAPAAFQPRDEVEFGLRVQRTIGEREPADTPGVIVSIFNGAAESRKVRVEFPYKDFFGNEVGFGILDFLPMEPGASSVHGPIVINAKTTARGFIRVHGKLTADGATSEHTLRMAVLPELSGKDSRFGVNHAYPWPHLLDECRQAGLLWMRDWSLKWQTVEPEKGRFDFTEADYQIDRPRKHGLQVLGLLPFPSANWSSSAPESVKVTQSYPGNRVRVAYAPRDEAEFENYVAKTVEHYKGRITWWQCFNEPLYTDYSLPRKLGYDGATYAKLTQAFARAVRRANPQAKVLAGIGGLHEGQIMDDFEKFFAAGGLAASDAIDIHHYPQQRPPEFFEKLLEQLNALMDKHGGRKPIWLTEYGYYAEDEPWTVPLPHNDFDQPLPSERVQAEYAVRWATLCFANGVEKIFYHAGTCGGINSGSLQGVFFGYGGQPRKIYAAQAVMAHLLTPTCRFVKKLALGEGVRAYLFRDGQRLVCVVWAPKAGKPRPITLADGKLVLWDLMGRPQSAREFTPSGTPVYLLADGLTDAAFEAGLK